MKKPPTGRKPLPTELPRIEHRHEVESCSCGSCGQTLLAMIEIDANDTFTGKRTCNACIRETVISVEIQSSGKAYTCDYCGSATSSESIEVILAAV